MLEQATLPRPLEVFVKVNTGMNRLGFAPARRRAQLCERLAQSLRRSPRVRLMMHFARADEDDGIAEPLARFERACARLAVSALARQFGGRRPLRGSRRRHRAAGHHALRRHAVRRSQRAVARARARDDAALAAHRACRRSNAASASATARRSRAPQPMRIGVVACGYADGYPRHAPNGTPVLVCGQRVPMAGRVSMDMLTVDLSSCRRRASAATSCCGATDCRSTTSRPPRRRSATNCCAPSRRACRVVTTTCGGVRPRHPDRRRTNRVHRRHRRRRLHRIEPRQGAQRARRDATSSPSTISRTADKFRNLADCDIADYFDKDEFLFARRQRRFRRRHRRRLPPGRVLGHDGDRRPLHAAQQLPLLGDAARALPGQRHAVPVRVERVGVRRGHGVSRGARERGAAQRLRLFEVPVRPATCAALLPERTAQIAGFRYFNVYGPRERTRGAWRRSRTTSSTSTAATAACGCSKARAAIADGEQRRDFVHVDDVVAANLDFLDHPERSGIFNLGTGTRGDVQRGRARRRSTRAVARQATRRARSPSSSREGAIAYVPMPDALAGKYQSFTQADLSRCARRAIDAPMLSVEEGVPRYVESLISGERPSS